mgnify:CR=1 FL=1
MTAGSTTFPILSIGGPDPGTGPTLNTQTGVPFIKTVTVSAGGRNRTFTLPDNAFLHSSNGFVTVKVSGIAQGAKLQIGDGTTDGLYGTANAVSAVGVYAFTLTESAVSAKTVVVKVTASVAGSAADLADVNINVTLIGGIIRD